MTVSDTSSLVSEDQAIAPQPANAVKPDNTLQNDFATLLNKQSLSILEPTTNQASVNSAYDNMELSDSEDENIPVIYVYINPDSPSGSTSQTNQDLPTPPTPQPIKVSPPPTILLQSIVLREVCENIFKDLMQLVKSRNNPIHSENYEGKWIALREVLDRVFYDL